MKRIYIINPASGKIRANRYEKMITKLMKKYKPEEEIYIYLTQKPNDIKNILKDKVTEDTVLYTLGGDGTINEALLSVLKYKIRFVPVPAGTGNDYAKSIYSYKTARKIIINSFEDKYKKVDMMQTTYGYAINVVNCGFDAQVADNIKYFRKVPLISGKMVYDLSILFSLFFNRNYKFKVRIDGKPKKGTYTLCAIGKGRFYGGGVEVLPKANLSDKKIDVCLIRSTDLIDKLKFLPKMKNAKHEGIKGVEMFKCNTISVVSTRKFPLSIDGEIKNVKKLKVSVLPQAIKISKQK